MMFLSKNISQLPVSTNCFLPQFSLSFHLDNKYLLLLIFLWIFLPDSLIMPGHDHHLQYTYQHRDLNSYAAILNWSCPVDSHDGEDITVIFKRYFYFLIFIIFNLFLIIIPALFSYIHTFSYQVVS